MLLPLPSGSWAYGPTTSPLAFPFEARPDSHFPPQAMPAPPHAVEPLNPKQEVAQYGAQTLVSAPLFTQLLGRMV